MTDTALNTNHQHPPLAIDGYGNPIEIPDGVASWRICRKTTGRPREIVDENKNPIRFPLDTTANSSSSAADATCIASTHSMRSASCSIMSARST